MPSCAELDSYVAWRSHHYDEFVEGALPCEPCPIDHRCTQSGRHLAAVSAAPRSFGIVRFFTAQATVDRRRIASDRLLAWLDGFEPRTRVDAAPMLLLAKYAIREFVEARQRAACMRCPDCTVLAAEPRVRQLTPVCMACREGPCGCRSVLDSWIPWVRLLGRMQGRVRVCTEELAALEDGSGLTEITRQLVCDTRTGAHAHADAAAVGRCG